jgi:hypothetical protein
LDHVEHHDGECGCKPTGFTLQDNKFFEAGFDRPKASVAIERADKRLHAAEIRPRWHEIKGFEGVTVRIHWALGQW